MLVAHAAVAIVIVALTSGNVGTLVRHRSLVLLYLIWLSVMGAHECIRLMLADGEGKGDRADGNR